MPVYAYKCKKCEHEFEELLSVSKRSGPAKKPCPGCGEKGIYQKISMTTMGVDMNVTPDKKTGGDWSRLMDKMKYGTPSRYHNQFDRASNNSGGKLGPQ